VAATALLMVTATVPDLDAILPAWTSATEYEVVQRHDVRSGLESLWGTDASAHRSAAVTRAPGTERGFVRLVDGGPAAGDGPIYEIQGPMAIEFFARDASEVHSRFSRGTAFVPITEPVDYDLTSIGSGTVQSVGFRAAGGLTLFVSTMKWVPPPRQLPVSAQFLGPAVNVPIVALDRQRSNDFYTGLLGIPVRFDGPVQDADVNRIMGAPAELAYHITVFFIADGQMAEHHFHDPRRVAPPEPAAGRLRGGAAGSTFRVSGLDDLLGRARAAGYQTRGPAVLGVEPYGSSRVAALSGPNGELVELVEG
jgi:catechol 2,3-dioxygenase-like lactoylglutathione lyase family enzyme